MQINGRLHLDLKVESKEYKLSANICMKENVNTADIDQEAETIANRIMERVRQKSSQKSQSIGKFECKQETKQCQTEHMRSQEQSQSRQETLKNDFKYIPEYRSSCKMSDYPIDLGEVTTPPKNKRRLNQSQTSIKKDQITSKKNIQLAESQYIVQDSYSKEVPQKTKQNTKDGKQILQLMQNIIYPSDNVHNLVRKNSQILSKVNMSTPKNTSKVTHNFITQNSSKKEDIVTQLLGSLRNAKKIKDEYQKRMF